jgi:hypothetical protein
MNTVQSGGQGISTHKKDPGLEVRRILIVQIIDLSINAVFQVSKFMKLCIACVDCKLEICTHNIVFVFSFLKFTSCSL